MPDVESRGGPPPLFGRERLLEGLGSGIAAFLGGDGTGFAILGDPGVGKSALWRAAVARVPSAGVPSPRVLEVEGVESEAQFPYSALQRLIAPLAATLGTISKTHARPLRSVLGFEAGSSADGFAVGAAVMALLEEAARAVPTIVVVESAQWVDHESLSAIAFAARRLTRDPVAIVTVIRSDAASLADLTGLHRIMVEPLDAESARALLAHRLDGISDPALQDLLIERAGGNARALTAIADELEDGTSADDLLARLSVGAALPTRGAVDRATQNRMRTLSAPARRLALIVAEESSGRIDVIFQAAQAWLGNAAASPDAVIDELSASGLVELTEGRLQMRDPLARASISALSSPESRRAAHAGLAVAYESLGMDPARVAWHLAGSVHVADESVAARLEASADQIAAVGGHVARSAFLRRAAELSPDRDQARRRRLTSAMAA
ncbi:AAA family ATPase, partial [Microbacterium sp.]|uniref:AAA family ATPase n=1 Tax=Microbacterium sp. TaxID=51671 RepID=UPI003C748A8A